MKVTLEWDPGQDGGPVVVWHWPDDAAGAMRYRDRWFPAAHLGVVAASTSLKQGQLLVTNAQGG